ncbi:hypothetical protein GCM10020001_081010 [Nonomuraea salmonea]
MRQRQEQQRGRLLAGEHRLERAAQHVECGEQQVVVRDAAALGPPGGARGVDDGGEVGGGDLLPARLDVGLGDAAGLQRAVHPPQRLELGRGLLDGLLVRVELDERRLGRAVGDDPPDLLDGGGLVDRHGDGADRPDGVVDERPLVAGARHERDPVAVLDAGRDQALGHLDHLVAELGRGHHRPARLGLAPHHHDARLLLRAPEDGVGQAGGGRHIDQDGDAVLAHELNSSSDSAWTLPPEVTRR